MSENQTDNQERKSNEPIVLTAQELIDVQELAAYMTHAQIADYLEIAERTFRKIMDRQPAARAAYKKGRALAHKKVANSLIAQANDGNTAAAIFYLKTQQGWKEETQATIDLPQLKRVSPNATE